MTSDPRFMTEQADTASTEFRLRGRHNTRIEIFTDAAFAFALTMLVISIDNIPQNIPQLVDALKDAPAFGVSFALIMLYWRGHQLWCQRYGLEDIPTVLLSCLLIFVVMIYVYPLKILFSAMFHVLSNGWLEASFQLHSIDEFRQLLLIYSSGFTLLNLPLCLLYLHAWRQRRKLRLTVLEIAITQYEIFAWLIVASFGLLSIALALTLPQDYLPLSAWQYSLLAFVMPVYGIWSGRKIKALVRQSSLDNT
ncbi:MAG: hypothetical protein Tsb002_11070 [Wenzhouxiangellaceae bacterium]